MARRIQIEDSAHLPSPLWLALRLGWMQQGVAALQTAKRTLGQAFQSRVAQHLGRTSDLGGNTTARELSLMSGLKESGSRLPGLVERGEARETIGGMKLVRGRSTSVRR